MSSVCLRCRLLVYSVLVMKRNTLARSGFSSSLGALLLAVLVFFGAFDRSPAAAAHLLLDAAGAGDGCSLAAASPGNPLRCERATMAKRRWSPFRLQHLRAKTANLCGAASVAPLELRSALPADPDLAAARAGRRPTGARAPPFA
jgi:hypothetical protein